MSKESVYFGQRTAHAVRLSGDFSPTGDPDNPVWTPVAREVFETSYDPSITYPEARTEVAIGWTVKQIYIAFWSRYTELNVYEGEDPTAQRWELWDRDVAEVFVNPFPEFVNQYWEFEVAPNNQWIDLAIDLDRDPFHNADWYSGFEHSTSVDELGKIWFCEMRIPALAFGLQQLEVGMEWRANFYRCDGPGDDSVRRFLAWSPTYESNFHVPESFGRLLFVDVSTAKEDAIA
jgi:alpha-galactosidase